jgi:hypothetical protein
MSAQLPQGTQGYFGKSRAATPGLGFHQPCEMLRRVAHTPGGAVNAHQTQRPEETSGMQGGISQWTQSFLRDEGEEVWAEPLVVLAEGGI